MVLLHDIPHFLRLPSQQQLKLRIRRRLGWWAEARASENMLDAVSQHIEVEGWDAQEAP